MKRSIAFFLLLALVCSLFGCAKEQPTKGPERITNSTAIFVDQACSLAQKVAMSAEPGYLQALEAPAEVLSRAGILLEVIGKEPTEIKLLTTETEDFAAEVTKICSQANGTTDLACCSILSVNTLIYMTNPPAKTTAVYLRYSDACHMVAIFDTWGTHTVKVTVYPMFYETAEALLKTHFANTKPMTQDEIKQAKEKATDISMAAEYTGSSISKLYYYKLAHRALTATDPIDPTKIREATSDEAVAKLAERFAQVMITEPTDIALFRFPKQISQQAQNILSQTQYRSELDDLTNQRVYLGWLSQLCAEYGVDCYVANALLSSLDNSRPIGMVANKTVQPALAVLDMGGDVTLVIGIYPNENNIYAYRYVCIPVSYKQACDFLLSQGAINYHIA